MNTDKKTELTQISQKKLALVGVEDLAGLSVRFGNGHLVEIDCVPGMFVTVQSGGRIVIHGPHEKT